MEIIVTFIKTSLTPKKKKAIEIAKRNNYNECNNEISATFNEINKDLITLLELAHTWNLTTIKVDKEEVNFTEFRNVIDCCWKNRCSGICINYGFNSLRFLNDIDYWKVKDDVAYVSRFEINDLLDYSSFKLQDGNTFVLDKEKLKEEILESKKLVFKYCKCVDKDKIFKLIGKLPNKFLIVSREEIEEQRKIEMNKEHEEERNKMKEELNTKEFEGFTKYELGYIRAKAKIQAEELSKELIKIIGGNKHGK